MKYGKISLGAYCGLLIITCGLLASGCISIKGFEKMYVSDEEMQLKEKLIERFEINVETYREGASGANGGQTGGGCGCN